jgi:hypothetical protein
MRVAFTDASSTPIPEVLRAAYERRLKVEKRAMRPSDRVNIAGSRDALKSRPGAVVGIAKTGPR